MKGSKFSLASEKNGFLSWIKFAILMPWINVPWSRRFDLDFWQTSKQNYNKFQYREKVFREVQGLPQFPRKMVLYLLAKLGIINPWTNIWSLRTFNLGFWQTWKQIYQKLQWKGKVFEGFQGLCCFPSKVVLYSWIHFGILKPATNIPLPGSFALGFWQTSKQIYTKLQYRKKSFSRFSRLLQYLRKLVLYLLTKLAIIKPWTNIQSLGKSDLEFWQSSKQIYRKL